MLDKFSRNISYLRISVTDRCCLRCLYCMPEEGVISKSHNDILPYEKIINVVREAIPLGISKIRITGGEPLVRKGILYLIGELKKLEGLEELTLTTNGVLLDRMAVPLKESGLDRINISLDTLDPVKYARLTRIGDIQDVLRGIDATLAAGFKNTKINMVLIPGTNDDEVEKMREFCAAKGLKLQRISHYSLSDIHSINHHFESDRPLKCEGCNRIRLTSDGKLKPCLFSDIEIPLDFSNLRESLIQAIMSKPQSGTSNSSRENWQIGG